MGQKASSENYNGAPLYPIYQCPPPTKMAWIAQQPKEVQFLKRAGAVQTSSSPLMSRSDEILSSDGRYPSFKCIEYYSASYVPGEDPYDRNAMNDGTTMNEKGAVTEKFTRAENKLYDRYGVIY